MRPAHETSHHFEVITEAHDVAAFDCGNAFLNRYLHQSALDDTENDRARTYVCVDEDARPSDSIVGYITLHAAGFAIGTYYVSAVEVSRLARAKSRRGEGWGDVLCVEALAIALQVGTLVGVRLVQLEPTKEGIALYRRYGFSDHPVYQSYLALPLKDIPRL